VIHLVFERRRGRLAVFGPDGRLWHAVEAEGDARRDGPRPPHGPGFPIPPGHYHLTGQVEHDPATPDDGPGLIYVDDLNTTTLQQLVHAGRARARDGGFEIARLPGAVGELARYGRTKIAIRGGGPALAQRSPAEDPLAPYQRLTPGDGGIRVHNADLARLMMILGPPFDSRGTVVLTVLGDPAPVGEPPRLSRRG
jgi:hypothetical protein